MKTLKASLALAFIAIIASGLTSCRDKVYEKRTYMANVPIYMSFEQWRQTPVTVQQSRALENPGKIYFKDDYLYVNEINQGIHVIDNSDPSNPQNLAFIEIPGNIDIAIRNNTMYVDSHIDLIALDISNPLAPILVDREEDVFNSSWPTVAYDPAYPIANIDLNAGVIIGWQLEEVTEVVDVNAAPTDWLIDSNTPMMFEGAASFETTNTTVNTVGLGGSTARFTIYGDYLYTVKDELIKVFNVTTDRNPSFSNEVYIDRVVETIFPAEDKLFIGTTSGMLIYTLATPDAPSFVSAFDHVVACDPVVVDGDLAYVTLRTGTECWGQVNRLDVVDLSNIYDPTLMRSYGMTNPHGLGIDNNTLFICDGEDGLKIYDATDPNDIMNNMLSHFQNINTFDVIPFNNVLMMIGTDGLYQYDYSDVTNIQELSVIPVQ